MRGVAKESLQMSSETLGSHDHQAGAAIAIAYGIYQTAEKPITVDILEKLRRDVERLRRQIEAIVPIA